MTKDSNCLECAGRGVSGEISYTRCPVCRGSGRIPHPSTIDDCLCGLDVQGYNTCHIDIIAAGLGATRRGILDALQRSLDVGAMVYNPDTKMIRAGD